MTNRFLVMTLTILVLFVMPLIFAQSVRAEPLESFAENPIPYWLDNSAGVDVSWDSSVQTVTLEEDIGDVDYEGSGFYSESFAVVTDWAYQSKGGIGVGQYGMTTDGDVGEVWVTLNDTGNEWVMYEHILTSPMSIDTWIGWRFKCETSNIIMYVYVVDSLGAVYSVVGGGLSTGWYIDEYYLGACGLSDIKKIRLQSTDWPDSTASGTLSVYWDYLYIGVPDLDLRVPIMQQATQSIELMGNFSGLNSTVRFQFYDNNTASGLWCDVTNQNVTFPDATYAEFTDIARINFTLDGEIRISKIYVSAQNMTLLNYYADYEGLANNDYLRMNDSAFEGSFQLWYLQGDVAYLEEINDMTGDLFYELFLSLEMWGYFGPLALVVIGYFLTKKEKGLGIFFIIVDSLIIATYLTLVDATPQYWWHIFILILGVIQCTFRLVSR